MKVLPGGRNKRETSRWEKFRRGIYGVAAFLSAGSLIAIACSPRGHALLFGGPDNLGGSGRSASSPPVAGVPSSAPTTPNAGPANQLQPDGIQTADDGTPGGAQKAGWSDGGLYASVDVHFETGKEYVNIAPVRNPDLAAPPSAQTRLLWVTINGQLIRPNGNDPENGMKVECNDTNFPQGMSTIKAGFFRDDNKKGVLVVNQQLTRGTDTSTGHSCHLLQAQVTTAPLSQSLGSDGPSPSSTSVAAAPASVSVPVSGFGIGI